MLLTSPRLVPLLLTSPAAPRSSRLLATSAPAAYDKLKLLLREASALSEVEGILSYDEMCFMPSGAAGARADQKAALAKVRHAVRTGPEMRDAIDAVRALGADPSLSPRAAANVRDAVANFDKESRKSAELAAREARLESKALGAWQAARAESDFAAFAPALSELLECKREVAAVTVPDVAEPYDGALDRFERGMSAARLDELFGELRASLVPLLAEIEAAKASNPAIDAAHPALAPSAEWDVAEQASLCREVAGRLGDSFDHGRLDTSAHPFTGGGGPTDVRITSRYSENWAEGLGGVVHEAGHALYEQGRDMSDEARGLPAGEPLSMGVHESQSLLWERHVGQSEPFWRWAAPAFHARFPHTRACSPDDFYRAYNRVAPGPIRVDADEVSYSLHVILRYDLERALFDGDMQVADLPDAWNSRMRADLGVSVESDARGCLQDIHWAMGAFGYFPSYSLGAVLAAQLYDAAQTQLGGADALDARIAAGEFSPLRDWLREKVHRVGSVHASPDELLTSVCGEGVSVGPFVRHLRGKYSRLYDL